MRLLRDLTARRFKDGAVARVLAMEFWARGEAPTFEEFARSWTKANAKAGCAARKLGQYAAREVGHLKDVHSTRL